MAPGTDTYLSFYSLISEYAPISALSLFLLCMLRLAPVIVLAPFFGTKTPSPVKMGLLLALTMIFFPHVAVTSKTFVGFNTEFSLLCFKEFFVGLVLAIFVSIPFFIAQTSGVIIDFVRGASSLQVTDPFTQSQASDLGILYNLVMIVIFYQIDGPYYFFGAFLDSYNALPADAWIPSAFFNFDNYLWQNVWNLANQVITVGIQLAAPSLLAVLMTEMFLGIANRLAQQVQIAFLGMSLKSLVGLGILAVAWSFIIQQMAKQAILWMNNTSKVIQHFQP